MAVLYRAAWVLPIAGPPIPGGWVQVDGGRIVALGSGDQVPSTLTDVIDLGCAALLPGLVNAHTHLELSWMAGRLPPSDSMPAWAAALMALRRTVDSTPLPPVDAAILDARAAGTSLVGDVTNTLDAYAPLLDSELAAAVFRELLGFNAGDPARVVERARRELDELLPVAWLRTSIVPHAPYSVSPELFRAIAAAGHGPLSVHVGESEEEVRFLQDGTGAWRELLGQLGAWNDRWTAPACRPVEYLDRLGLVSDRLLAVHCVQADDGELARLAAAGATIVTCPRSNRWTGAGAPPIERFFASGARVAIGTDSLASVEDLNVFAELAAARRLAPVVPARHLLASATLHAAEALGFGADFGSITPGKRADLIAVTVPPNVEDVEEYLLSGIEPPAVRWTDDSM